MKKISINVVVELGNEYITEGEVEIEISDTSYEKLIPLCDKMDESELEDEDCQDLLEQEAPDVLAEIEKAVDDAMPDCITPNEDEGETLDDYDWSPMYNTIML